MINILEHNVRATADFHQRGQDGVQASGVKGELLNNGNFIFVWKDGKYMKMVLTQNDGRIIEDGYMLSDEVDKSNWKNSAIWKHGSKGFYYIQNFKVYKGTAQYFLTSNPGLPHKS